MQASRCAPTLFLARDGDGEMGAPSSRYQNLSAAQQYLNLRCCNICPGYGSLRRELLIWNFEVRPTPLSRLYRMQTIYRVGKAPRSLVIDPDLTLLATGRRLPHVYEQKPTRICLYLPRTREWLAHMKIADTIIPWAILWLFYFEEWLISDEWKGGGTHPRKQKCR